MGWGGVGWGGVKYFKSNAKVSLAHSHPPSHIIRNTKENQLLLRRLLRICVYIYICKYLPHFPIYCLIFSYVCKQVPTFCSYICCYMLLYVSQYCLILSYIFSHMFWYFCYIFLEIFQYVQIGSNIFGSREHGIIIPIGIPYGAFFSALELPQPQPYQWRCHQLGMPYKPHGILTVLTVGYGWLQRNCGGGGVY